ncbi:MAG TPA: hypothetical protein VGB45_16675 [Abditibacterium sp.]|jgi:hypothetical protein
MKNHVDLPKYERMKKVGATPEIIYRTTLADGIAPSIHSIRILRSIFPELTLADAKEVTVRLDTGLSLSDYQEKYLLPAIEQALKTLDEGES